ncbi:hypothetical protein Tco_0766408 [Tanacetum coccineum]
MSTQQDMYVASSETHPPMLNKENYVPWSSSLLRYATSRPNGKLITNHYEWSYVSNIPKPGYPDREVPVNETFHEQTEIYDAVNSCKTTQEIWLHVQQMIKDSDIGIQEKKAKLFNEWERFTSTDRESIESYYHHFLKLMNDFKRKKHFPEKIASNLKYGNLCSNGQKWGKTDRYKLLEEMVVQNAVQNLGVQNVRNQNGLIVVSGIANQNPNGNGNVVATRAEGNANGNMTQLEIAQKEEAGIKLQAEEFDLMAATGDLDEIEEVNANCILMDNLQQALNSRAVYWTSTRASFLTTQYNEDSNVISEVSSMEHGVGTVEQHPATVEETHAYFESLYNNLAIKVEKFSTVNRKLRDANL